MKRARSRSGAGARCPLAAVALLVLAPLAAAAPSPGAGADGTASAGTADSRRSYETLAAGGAGGDAIEAAALAGLAGAVEQELAAGRVAGAVVLVGRGDRIVYRRAFGARAVAPATEPMTADTVFDLASLTKVVATTTAVMQLVDDGRLALDEPVARVWPEFAASGKGAVTVRHLLTHHSGLPQGLDAARRGDVVERVAGLRLVADPGSAFSYGDLSFVALGEVVRRAAGEPLDAYCAAHVFGPLGMVDTGFRPPPTAVPRVAPTLRHEGRWLRGEPQDPIAARMGGVAGNAGLFSTADDLARFARMLLDGGRAPDRRRILSQRSVAAMSSVQSPPASPARRGLGWDIASPFASPWSERFGPRSFGHTGYTGVSLWIDPASRTYVVLLTSRLHPDGRGDVRPLRAAVATSVARDLTQPPTTATRVRTGIDSLREDGFAGLVGRRIGLITNHSGRDAQGQRTIDVLRAAPGVSLAAIFSPEHGLDGAADAPVGDSRDAATGIPVYSLYGAVKAPTSAVLADLDALVFDVQDVGARFFTYISTMARAMRAAAERGIPFWVLDRPDPIDASVVQGPMLDPDLRSFTAVFPLPVRYGLTVGELAGLVNAEDGIGADLRVVRMHGYRRESWYDETGLAWIGPSPNLRSLTQAALYPGVALVEGANVSVGRGTDTPFEVVGAPWIDGRRLADALAAGGVAGVRFAPTRFVPRSSAYARRECGGVRIALADRRGLDAPELGIEIIAALHRLYPRRFDIDRTLGMVGARWVLRAIRDGEEPAEIARRWQAPLAEFRVRRARYLLY